MIKRIYYTISILISLYFISNQAFGMSYFVSPKGNDNTGNGSQFAPWRSIQYTIDQAFPGDTIKVVGDNNVFTNDYIENIIINKSLMIENQNDGGSHPQIRALDAMKHIFHITASEVTIKGLDIYGANRGIMAAGICLENISGCTIINNRVGWDKSHKCRVGILLRSASNNIIEGNSCSFNENAVMLNESDFNYFVNNLFSFSVIHGIRLFSSNHNIFKNNTCNFSQAHGIFVYNKCSNNKLFNNICSFNRAGIRFQDQCHQNLVYNNKIYNNKVGIEFVRDSDENRIYHNYLFNNSQKNVNSEISINFWQSPAEQKYSKGGLVFNSIVGNYYDDYKGSDENKDGIGDSPYLINRQLNQADQFVLIDTSVAPIRIFPDLKAIAGDGEVILTWRSQKTDIFSKYYIYGGTIINTGTIMDSVINVSDTVKVITGLTSTEQYYFNLVAINHKLQKCGFSSIVSAKPTGEIFSTVTSGLIVNEKGSNFGCAWGDFNNDNYLDLFVASHDTLEPNLLYANQGDGTFAKVNNGNIAHQFSVSKCGSWGDYNSDNLLDLFISNSANDDSYSVHNSFYMNQSNGNFMTSNRGIVTNDPGNFSSCNWIDFDNNGTLDMYVTNFIINNFLYSNNGDGTFSKIHTGSIVNGTNNTHQAVWGDYDNDNDMDVFIAKDFGVNNELYRNDNNGIFTKINTGPVVTDGGNSLGGSWGDYDNDGYLDLFVTNNNQQKNFLYHNNGDGSFSRILNGDIVNEKAISGTSNWGDFNNDGKIDLFVCNKTENNSLFLNMGNGAFKKIFNQNIVNDESTSCGCCWGDYDNDGDLDIFVANCGAAKNLLYRNNGNRHHWINIKCVGTKSNRSAIGTKVRVKARIFGKYVWQLNQISSLTGMYCQNSLNAEFGLGDATVIDSIIFEWPSGIVQVMSDVEANQFMTVEEIDDFAFNSKSKTKLAVIEIDYIDFSSEEQDSINNIFNKFLIQNEMFSILPETEITKILPNFKNEKITNKKDYVRLRKNVKADYILFGEMNKFGEFIEYQFQVSKMPNGTLRKYSGGKTMEVLLKNGMTEIFINILKDINTYE